MPCGSCGARRGITADTKFIWTDGTKTVTYTNERVARAKVLRKGGSYTRKD